MNCLPVLLWAVVAVVVLLLANGDWVWLVDGFDFPFSAGGGDWVWLRDDFGLPFSAGGGDWVWLRDFFGFPFSAGGGDRFGASDCLWLANGVGLANGVAGLANGVGWARVLVVVVVCWQWICYNGGSEKSKSGDDGELHFDESLNLAKVSKRL